ncbi:MAG: pyridoxal-dependent decarboxylase [Myxococcaceae bacterium]
MGDELSPWFLGAYGENNDTLEKLVLELLRDHVYWRRNFHPEDPPPIGTRDQYEPAFLDALARTRHELHQLSAQLKRSVPFFHPRYLGHMVSDLLLPGLVAQIMTTLYNPNNVVEDVAPVTVKLELEVGRQLATMLGLGPKALGHLTSGGTIANDEGLWLARAVKLFPLAAKDGCAALDTWPDAGLKGADDFDLLQWPVSRVLDLVEMLERHPKLLERITAFRVEKVGLAKFVRAHPVVADLAVLAPGTAHYSWAKAMKLLGLGSDALLEVPTVQARLDATALATMLAERKAKRLPVLAVVGVYGTTEFGTLDPLDALVQLRDAPATGGFWLHADAAWGGYLPSLFRDERGGLRPRAEIAAEFRYFPSERVYRATAALGEADSVTVDPHKLGFVPYGAGAFLARDRRAFGLVHSDAAYVFGSQEEADARWRLPGRFSLEGSRPGAAAAACYVNHRVLPLDGAHFGRLIARSIKTCETLFDRIQALRKKLEPRVALALPFDPDCNLVCLAFNVHGNRSLAKANAVTKQVFDRIAVHADEPVQVRRFFGSFTTVELSHLGASERERIGRELDLDLSHAGEEGLFVLRHTLMNPWLLSPIALDSTDTYLDAYVHWLEATLTSLPSP